MKIVGQHIYCSHFVANNVSMFLKQNLCPLMVPPLLQGTVAKLRIDYY